MADPIVFFIDIIRKKKKETRIVLSVWINSTTTRTEEDRILTNGDLW